jgi:hypothetical protein
MDQVSSPTLRNLSAEILRLGGVFRIDFNVIIR